MPHFYNTCLNSLNISSLFSGGITISSTGFVYRILLLYNLVTACAILSPKNSLVLWTTFLEEVFKESSPVSNNCFLFVRKISCKWQKSVSFKKFSCSWFYRTVHHFYLLIGNVKLTFPSISNRNFIRKCYNNFIKLSIVSYWKY